MKTLTRTPKFCFISPQRYLKREWMSDTHLVLAHLIADPKYKPYVDFYRERSRAGDYIICDTGVFEGQMQDPNKLIELANEIGADSLVLPDYPGERASKTIEAAEKWIPKYMEAGLDPFFVPQGERGSLKQWLSAYEFAAQTKEIGIIGMSILGIPNALPNVPKEMARVIMAEKLLSSETFSEKAHHWLGLNSPMEMQALVSMGVVNTMDSSGPIQYAIHGHKYDTTKEGYGVPMKKYIRHVDFDLPYHECALEFIQHNVSVVKKIFSI